MVNLAFQSRHQKFESTNFILKMSYNVNEPILKGLCKFQADIPITARVKAVQSLKIRIMIDLVNSWSL